MPKLPDKLSKGPKNLVRWLNEMREFVRRGRVLADGAMGWDDTGDGLLPPGPPAPAADPGAPRCCSDALWVSDDLDAIFESNSGSGFGFISLEKTLVLYASQYKWYIQIQGGAIYYRSEGASLTTKFVKTAAAPVDEDDYPPSIYILEAPAILDVTDSATTTTVIFLRGSSVNPRWNEINGGSTNLISDFGAGNWVLNTGVGTFTKTLALLSVPEGAYAGGDGATVS